MDEMTLASFLDMGGYASYIWPVYGMTAILMIGLLIQSIIAWRQNEAELTLLRTMSDKKKTVNKKKAAPKTAAKRDEEEEG